MNEKESLRDKMLDTALEHFLGLVQEMTTAVEKEDLKRINDDVIRTRAVLREIKEIFATPVD